MNRGGRSRLQQGEKLFLNQLVSNRLNADAAKVSARTFQAQHPGTHRNWTDFESLPHFRELKQQRSLADLIGLQNPFFRVHDTAAGATTIINGRTLINFSSYDYLGLNQHPEVRSAAHSAIDTFGLSSSASRLVAGERPMHQKLELALANHYGYAHCVVYVSGHATNVATISTLLGPKDLILYDQFGHNSTVSGAILSRAERRAFPHNDLAALDAILESNRSQFERVLIAVEGLYSMDGDTPNLPELIAIKRKYDAWLLVDDAHGLGVLGSTGLGVFEHFQCDPKDVDIWMGTLSKTLAACGGYIVGPAGLIDYLKCISGGFVYSVGLSPPLAASAAAALHILHREPERVAMLRDNSKFFLQMAEAEGLEIGTSEGFAIIPIILGNSLLAVLLSQRLFERGINVQPIIHPAVPEQAARLRFFLNSTHTKAHIADTVRAVAEELQLIKGGSGLALDAALLQSFKSG